MADHRNKSSPSRNRNMDPTYDVHDEDPLVELARIVSEEGGYLNISEDGDDKTTVDVETRDVNAQPETDVGQAGADSEFDLENQLMEELEISMAPSAHEIDSYDFEGSYQGDGQEYDRVPDLEAEELPTDDFAEEEFGAEEFAGEDFAGEEFALDDNGVQDPQISGPTDVDHEQSGYGYDAGEELSSEVSELLSEQELSELEQALAEAEGLEGGEVGAQFDDDMGLVGDVDFGEIPGEIDDLDDSIYQLPPPVSAGAEFENSEAGRERRSGRRIFAIAAVLSIAVLGGGVLAMMNSTSNKLVGLAPPVFKAGEEPVKVAPEAGSEVASNEKQTIFDVASTDTDPTKEELVERSEKPVDRIVPLDTANGTEGLRGTGGADSKDTARLTADAQGTSTSGGTTPIGPKQVTTVKVSADGTIIRPSLDETGPAAQVDEEPIIVGGLPAPVTETTQTAVAVDESRPVPVRVVEIKPTQPNSVAGTVDDTVARSESLLSGSGTGVADQGAGPAGASDAADSAIPRARPDETPEIEVASAQPNRNSGLVAQPAPQNGSGPVNLLKSNSGTQRAATTPTAPANTGSTSAGSGYLVQLSAQRSESQALAAFNGLKRQFPSLLGNYKPSIQRADLGERGIYYRVRVGPMASQSAANAFCEQLKSSGGNCFVAR